jgi:transcriptional regulator with XRE-family HTH domain
MPESFGARLRQRRERQEIALVTIAEQTKIKLSLLEELERDDVSHWPTGIFRRAFIRTYARAIGLDPDVVVREFLQLYPDPTAEIATEPAAPAGPDGVVVGPRPPTRFRYLIGSAMGSLPWFRPEAAVPAPAEAARVVPSFTVEDRPAARYPPVAPPASDPDLLAAAQLCTELGRVDDAGEVAPLLQEAARILDAVGLIVWVWDLPTAELRPALAHGYSDGVLAQLPTLKRDADNATAAAFRSAQLCTVDGGDRSSSALAVPLMTPMGCMGVLAIELRHNREPVGSVCALATIFAAQLAGWIGVAREVETVDRRLA